jgi:tRNA A-37 threonylcarbamoyl transferase component Bud32
MEQSTSRHADSSASATALDHDLTGESFDDFRVLRRLGEGGMGQVYLAEQISLKRNVAIKVLRPDLTTPTALARFRAESTTIAQLSHGHIVQAYTVGEYKGRHYLVMEYVDGFSLRDYLDKKGPPELPLTLSILRRVSSALVRAGELGIIHRDIKPENILLTRKAEVKVADFGLSRCLTAEESLDLTRSGTAVGTPRYMSPEQLEGKPIDQRSDIYSLGITLYEMLTGRTPFDGTNAFEIAIKHVREEAVPVEQVRPGLPPAVCALVCKMMSKNPDGRPSSARELLKDIARVRETLGDVTVGVPEVPAADEPTALDAIPKREPQERPAAKASRGDPTELEAPAVEPARKPKARRDRTVAEPPEPRRKQKASRALILGLSIGGGVLFLVVLVIILVASGSDGEPASGKPAPPSMDDARKQQQEEAAKRTRELTLRKAADPHLKEITHNPIGVDACVNLAVFYLEEERAADATVVFKRMSERKPPSTYHYVGRLGLAVVDAVNKQEAAAQEKFRTLFDPKTKDNRARILNDYLEKHPQFAEWVNEADAQDVRHTLSGSSAPKTPRPPFTGFPFKGKNRRP